MSETKLYGTAKQRARRGAKFLDKKEPSWFRKIRRGKLDMSNGCYCIIGQLRHIDEYDNEAYDRGAQEMHLDEEQQWLFGFMPLEGDNDIRAGVLTFDGPLESAWWNEIRKRRAKKPAAEKARQS